MVIFTKDILNGKFCFLCTVLTLFSTLFCNDFCIAFVSCNPWKWNMLFKFYFVSNAAQKMKFSIKDFFSKCDLISRKLRIWSYLRKKSLMENLNFVQYFILEFYSCLLDKSVTQIILLLENQLFEKQVTFDKINVLTIIIFLSVVRILRIQGLKLFWISKPFILTFFIL